MVKETEKLEREAERRFKKASDTWEGAAQRALSVVDEAEGATKAVEDAKRTIEKASKEPESLFASECEHSRLPQQMKWDLAAR